MAKTQIFKDYDEFLAREDKAINGVTADFVRDHYIKNSEQDTNNVGCWNCVRCWNCVACVACVACVDCVDCRDCFWCVACVDCVDCRNCWDCVNCVDCVRCKDKTGACSTVSTQKQF